MSERVKELIQAIQAAAEDQASPEDKLKGAAACQTLAALFGATAGQPLAPPAPAPTPLSETVERARGATTTVLLDGLIAKLRSYIPEETKEDERAPMLTVPFVPIPTRQSDDDS